MKDASISLKVFGLYMILVPGLGLICCPDLILDLFQLRHGEELWIPRMVGFLALAIGYYYLHFSKNKLEVLYRHTVILRYAAAAFMAVLYLMGEVEWTILLFAGVDLLGAVWTHWAMTER